MVQNSNANVLTEHRKIVDVRYSLAIINFVAILLSTLATLFFMNKKGAPSGMFAHIYALIGISAAQIVICIADLISRRFTGTYIKVFAYVSYVIGAAFVACWGGALYVGTAELGSLRMDLLVIAIVQTLFAIIAYVVWPSIDKRAINSLTRKSVRNDEKKRKERTGHFIRSYIALCACLVILQVGTLVAYKIPPKAYDLFDTTRAVKYELTEDKSGYVVVGIYMGTSDKVNIPAMYNGLPVVGIAAYAISDDDTMIENYRIKELTLGTQEKQEDGSVATVSNLTYIESNAINLNSIATVAIPASVTNIEPNAVTGSKISEVTYESQADFVFSCFNCENIQKVVMKGPSVGNIASLDGMGDQTKIQVNKDIYDDYRTKNQQYSKNFAPELAEEEICVDFNTDSNYYLKSIFGKKSDGITISYTDLVNEGDSSGGLVTDTLAYINNNMEVGTDGVKANKAFRGWYYDKEFTEECKFSLHTPVKFTESVSLYAKWVDEYSATLDWGNYTPEGAAPKIYWTREEGSASLPVIKDRTGYDGIVWCDANGTKIEDITKWQSLTKIEGKWALTPPTINISVPEGFAGSNGIEFTYDENTTLILSADVNHDIETKVTYSYEWKKDGAKVSQFKENKTIQNVADSGTYTLYVTMYANGDSATKEASINVTVNKKKIDVNGVRLEGADLTYNGYARNSEITYTGTPATDNVKASYAYYKNGTECNEMRDAGKYEVKVTFSKNNNEDAQNYESATLTADVTISPKQVKFEGWLLDGASATSVTYDGKEHTCSMKISGVEGTEDVKLKYAAGSTATNAGTYTARVEGVGNSNYSIQGIGKADISISWKIEKKEVSVSKWLLDKSENTNSVIYNAAEHNVQAVISGVLDADEVSFVYFYNNDSVNKATDAGTYRAKITGVSNDNYRYNTTDSKATFDWEIKKKKLTVTFDSGSDYTYNGEKQTRTAEISGFMGDDASALSNVRYFDISTDCAGKSAALSGENVVITFTATNAGTYEMTFNGMASSVSVENYSLSSSTRYFTINKKELSFTSRGYTYNGSEQDLEINVGNLMKEEDRTLANLDAFTYTNCTVNPSSGSNGSIVVKGKDAGTYKVTISGINGALSSNYQVTEQTIEIKVNPKKITVGTWSVKNNATGDICAKTLSSGTVVNDIDLVYNGYGNGSGTDGHGYTLTPVVSGLCTGDAQEELSLTLSGATECSADNYSSTVSMSANYLSGYKNHNYTLATTSVKWKINPCTVDFTWETPENLTYDGEEKKITPKYELIGGDNARTLTLTYADGANTLSATNAGDYTATITSTGNNNYIIGDGATCTWRIARREIGVTWSAQSGTLTYDGTYFTPSFEVTNGAEKGEEVTFTVDYDCTSGYVERYLYENAKKLTWDPNGGSEYVAIENYVLDAGTYTFTVKGVSSVNSNYTLASTLDYSYTYTVAQKEINIVSWVYIIGGTGAENEAKETLTYCKKTYAFSANAVGLVTLRADNKTDDSVTFKYDVKSKAGDTVTASQNVGGYIVKASIDGGTRSGNYTLKADGASYSYTINPKPLSLTWSKQDLTYHPSGRSVAANLEYGDAEGDGYICYGDMVTFNYEGNTATNVGNYTAKVIGIGNSNYEITSGGTCDWSISQAKITSVSWTATEMEYNGDNQHPTAVCKLGDETVSVDYAVTARDGGDALTEYKYVGQYTITASSIDTNYTLEECSNKSLTYTITQKNVSLTWYWDNGNVASDVEYDATERTISARVNGAVDGDTFELKYDKNLSVTDAGDYTFTVTSVGNENYTVGSSATKELKVSVRAIRLKFTWSGATTYTYDGTCENRMEATATNVYEGDEVNFYYDYAKNGEKVDYIETKAAGTYIQKINETLSGKSQGNYYVEPFAADTQKSFTVNPKEVTFTWNVPQKPVYNGSEYVITASADGVITGDTVTLTYSNDVDELANKPINAGTYTIRVESLGNDNYTFNAESGNTSVTIDKRAVTVTAWDIADNLTYNGKSQKERIKVSTTDVLTRDTVYFGYEFVKDGVTYTDVKDAGEYTVRIASELGGEGGGNYYVNYAAAYQAERSFTIAQKAVTPIWDVPNSIEYDGALHMITASISLTDTIDNEVVSVTSYKNNVDENGNNLTNAGTYTITPMGLSNANYKIDVTASTYTQSVTIDPKPVSISWGDAAREYTYTGNARMLTATVTNAISGDDVTVDSYNCYQYGENTWTKVAIAVYVGQYKYEVSTLKGDAASNYTSTNATGTSWEFNITQKTLTINWGGESQNVVNYDGQEHDFAPTVSGISNNDNVTLTYTITDKSSGLVRNGSSAKSAGKYTVTVTGIGGDATRINNYALPTDTTQEVEIKSVLAAFNTWAPEEKTYNGKAQTFESYPSSLNAREFGDFMNLSYVYKITDEKGNTCTEMVNAGVYTVEVVGLSGSAKDNYYLDMFGISSTLTIKPKEVTLTWQNDVATYSDSPIELYATVNGVLSADSATGVHVAGYQISTSDGQYSGNSATGAGTYKVTATGLDNANYSIASGSEMYEYVIKSSVLTEM